MLGKIMDTIHVPLRHSGLQFGDGGRWPVEQYHFFLNSKWYDGDDLTLVDRKLLCYSNFTNRDIDRVAEKFTELKGRYHPTKRYAITWQ